MKITKELRDILHGYIMSDGYLRKGTLTVDQGEKQKKFVEWLYRKLEPIRTQSPIKKVERTRKATKTNPETKTYSYRFYSQSVLKGFNNMWYKPYIDKNGKTKYKKVLPKSIDCFFNETFITLWFAGDGTKILDSLGAKFEVTAFSVEERLKLQNLFLTKFNIRTVIISSGRSPNGTEQKALKVPAEEYHKFRKLITKSDLITTIFPYKLHPQQK